MRLAGDPQFEAIQQAVENVCRIEFTGDQFVAHRRPAGFFGRYRGNAIFLSNPFSDAIAIGAQSVSGINPTRTVDCSGLSDPAAHALCITPGNNIAPPSAAPACKNAVVKSKIYRPYPLQNTQKSARQC